MLVGKCKKSILDAKQHVCARRDKSILESRFINVVKGFGVFATAVIPEGSFIVEYRGTLREARQCTPGPYSYYFMHKDTRYCIDAFVDDGSLGRLVNDDSDPNSKMKVVSVCEVPHLCLFALRDIQPGEEITYDYGGYDLPWRKGTWLCMGSLTQYKDETETCEGVQLSCDEQPAVPEPAEQTACKEEEPACTDKSPQTQTTEKITSDVKLSSNGEASQTNHEMVCEELLSACKEESIGMTQQEQQMIREDDFPHVQLTVQNDYNEETICKNEELSGSQPTNQVTHEVQMECEEQAGRSQSAEQNEVFEEQQTCMKVELHMIGQHQTESTEQEMAEDEEIQCKHEPPEVQRDDQMSCEVEQQTCENDRGQTQPAEQMASCSGEEQTSDKDSSQTSDKDSPQTSDKDSPQTSDKDSSQTSDKDSSQTSDKDSPQTSDKDSPQTATQSSEKDQNSSQCDVNGNEGVSSDEEFIPDSESDSENCSDHEDPVVPPNQNHLVTEAVKENFCFVCGKAYRKIARHLKVHRQENFEIANAFKLRKSSKERRRILEVLRNRGNYQHNIKVQSKGSGVIKAIRKPKDGIDTQKFEYCMFCKGLYMRKELWKHMRRCTSNPDRDLRKGTRNQILGLAAVAQCPHLQHVSEDVKKVLSGMHQDEIAQVVRNDEYVLKLAQDFFNKKSKAKEKHAFVRQTLRCIGKFLIALRKKSSIRNLAEALKPLNFPKVIEAVKEVAEYNEETNCFGSPSLARRVGLILRKFCIMTAEKALSVQDKRLIDQTSVFFKLFYDARPQFALGEKRPVTLVFSNPPLLPFVKGVTVLHCYLEKASQCALKELKEKPSAQSYADLSKLILAQILMFNRRHGEVSQMTVRAFQQRDKVQVPEDSLTEFEKEFCKHYCRIEVKQKMEGQVAIILTPEMVSALMLLIKTRQQCGVYDSNVFVFGQPKSNRYYRGENALRICAKESGAVNPEQLGSTAFSRHIATLAQVLSLKDQELRKLAKFIGHDISVRKEYYRQPEATARLAKLCKLILAIEKGSAANLLRDSLDDIILPGRPARQESNGVDTLFKNSTSTAVSDPLTPAPEIHESDSEDDFEEECELFVQRRARLHIAAQKMKKRDNSSTKTSNTECTQERDTGSATADVAEAESLVQVDAKLDEHKRTFVKKPWTKEEKAAVMKHFKKQIYQGKLALVVECQRCQMLEQPVLNRRTTQNIRDFVRNAGRAFRKVKAAKALSNKLAVPTPQVANPSSSNVQQTNVISFGLSPQIVLPAMPTAQPCQTVNTTISVLIPAVVAD